MRSRSRCASTSVPHRFSSRRRWLRRQSCPTRSARRPPPPHRPDRRAAGHHRRRGRARLRRRGVLPSLGQVKGPRAGAGGRHRRREPLRQAGQPLDEDAYERATSGVTSRAASSRCCREALQRAVLAEPDVERLAMVCDMLIGADGRGAGLPVLPGADLLARALHLHRGGGAVLANTRAAPRRPAKRNSCRTCCTCTRVYRVAQAAPGARRGGLRDHRDADRLRRERPHRERSCRARATTRTG